MRYNMDKQVISFDDWVKQNEDALNAEWEEYISFQEWGSGQDRIKITDHMFFEWAYDIYFKTITQR